jgi:hypothetical protein
MLASPQNRVFLGFVVRISLKNDWVIAQTELRAVVIEKLEAGSGKNNVGNTRHRADLQSVDGFQFHEACTARQSSADAYPCDAPGERGLQGQNTCQTINHQFKTKSG